MKPTARTNAIAEIKRIFGAYRAAQPDDRSHLAGLAPGKLYELFVLSKLLADLAKRGFTLTFVGSTLKFKASPGQIKVDDSHFEMRSPGSHTVDYRIFLDIEFDTLGHHQQPVSDNSRRHELDIIVTNASSGYPAHNEIALAVECKAVANFDKGLIKEALGVRRELSFLTAPQSSTLSSVGGHPEVNVAANPPSEFWLVFIDPKGRRYAQSPRVYGVELKHLQP